MPYFVWIYKPLNDSAAHELDRKVLPKLKAGLAVRLNLRRGLGTRVGVGEAENCAGPGSTMQLRLSLTYLSITSPDVCRSLADG